MFIATELEKIDYIALLKCYNSGVRFGGFILKISIQNENIENQKRKPTEKNSCEVQKGSRILSIRIMVYTSI